MATRFVVGIWLIRQHHLILDCTQAGNLNLDNITMLQPRWRFHECCNATWRASHYNRARLQGSSTAQKPQYSRDVMNQIIGRSVLSLFAVDKGLQLQRSRLWNSGWRSDDWTNGSEFVE